MANRRARCLEAGKRYSVARSVLCEGGRPLAIPAALIVHCLAAGGCSPPEDHPRLSARVARRVPRLFTFLKGTLAERRLSNLSIRGGTHVGR